MSIPLFFQKKYSDCWSLLSVFFCDFFCIQPIQAYDSIASLVLLQPCVRSPIPGGLPTRTRMMFGGGGAQHVATIDGGTTAMARQPQVDGLTSVQL